jgi:superfamily II DNA or RNA helicase
MPIEIKTKSLHRAANPSDYKLYLAALEWDLAETIVIENRQDLRSEPQWRGRVEPYHHQVTNLITFCRRLPVTLLADDVGLGKTISAGLVASELISRGHVSKMLIVCPKLLMPQWREELDSKFGIPSVEAVGQELAVAKVPGNAGAIITTYQSARLHFDVISKAGFEMLILDEAHKLRNLYGVDKPPQVATRFRQALADRSFKYVLMLTATPIQNRLWDLYSLVDLLAVARGHENPFGNEGMFARKFIADKRTQARQLRPERRDEFRSIVYSYMSRIRRADANLHFPNRKVQLHKVHPTPEETGLIKLIAEPIQRLNKLAQISILQALVSSPHALAAQLETMANHGTVPASLAADVRDVVERMQASAKLQGLASLIATLKKEQPDHWRAVVFTTRRETQSTIEAFLSEQGIACGLINGGSGPRNQRTIASFKKVPPEIHVIVSTEAGSEGVNLQAANVLVNYDLPWNPMIVEQRIGRVQRLASAHATVCIFNLILQGTFEEYIVGRLMEKLQMASHAIGDVEALLEAAGMDEAEGSRSFADRIRELVIAALVGKNVEEATLLAEKSITEAKVELEREEKNINAMFGGMDGAIDLGPRCPKLPMPVRSMNARDFSLFALKQIGARLMPRGSEQYTVELDGRRELIRFGDVEVASEDAGTLCRPGTAFFERLVSRIVGTALHQADDVDRDLNGSMREIVTKWAEGFGSTFQSLRIDGACFCFSGSVLLRVRAIVAHDSYERMIEIPCVTEEPKSRNRDALQPIGKSLENLADLGLPLARIKATALEDTSIAEFCRFYKERLAGEVKAAGEDARKRQKLEDDFTPRITMEVVGLEGKICRQVEACVSYTIEPGKAYESSLISTPSTGQLLKQPQMGTCASTGAIVPCDCLGACEVSGKKVLRHLLICSELGGRMALPEHSVICALSGKRVLSNEVEDSSVTGRKVTSALLKTSAISGKRAEPEFFSSCEFTSAEVLRDELAVSQISGKRYCSDGQLCSAVSGKTGHSSEFVVCSQTQQPLLPTEAERSEVSGKIAMPGHLEQCEITWKKAFPSELDRCAVTGKKALKKLFVVSSISGASLLEEKAVRSASGKFCTPLESKACTWTGLNHHPEDLRICELTELPFYFEQVGRNGLNRFNVLARLLDGTLIKADRAELWDDISARVSKLLGGARCKVETAELSPDGQHLAICLEARTWMGLKVRQAGLLYSTSNHAIIGRVVLGKREGKGWRESD